MSVRYQSRRCACGKAVYPSHPAHQRACPEHLEKVGYPLDARMRAAIFDEYRIGGADIVRAVERGLGKAYLARRAAGDRSAMPWAEYRDLVWTLAEAAAP